MSYIHYDDNYYSPIDNLRELLKLQIIQPFRDKLPHVAKLYDTRDFPEIKRLSEDILGQGSTNFNVPTTDERFGAFTPEDKVLFYCVYYMPMHLYSSYHIYNTCFMPQNALLESKHIVFIDYGCGPLTSGIAFWNAVGQRNVTYIGIDISQNMLTKASEINKHSPADNNSPYFKNITLSQNYEIVPELLSVVEENSPSDTVIVFNFCYVLAPITFIGDIRSFIDSIHNAVQVSTDYKICMVYQNPPKLHNAHIHWSKLQNEVVNYTYFPVQNFVGPNDTVTINYQRLMEGTVRQNHDVRYGMIYNW